ncbi:MAG: hypothetical protein F6K37_20885 [Moorea sp. SIO4E2]|uniref:hypothetical protein n=1 Tax=Moorena sp. SIO4E2 TaxID=2607826 RepID=UPI0013BCA4BD|nr:hypothetical protein [Moorena sp. SIO4E2]NEQ08310.1 hypothetical protein [Moorena sp. SIO4E2]
MTKTYTTPDLIIHSNVEDITFNINGSDWISKENNTQVANYTTPDLILHDSIKNLYELGNINTIKDEIWGGDMQAKILTA